jgi:hypothetical protein
MRHRAKMLGVMFEGNDGALVVKTCIEGRLAKYASHGGDRLGPQLMDPCDPPSGHGPRNPRGFTKSMEDA